MVPDTNTMSPGWTRLGPWMLEGHLGQLPEQVITEHELTVSFGRLVRREAQSVIGCCLGR